MMNVGSMDLCIYSGSSQYMSISVFVKFLGVVKTSHNMYKVSYLHDNGDLVSSNYMIHLLTDYGNANIYGDDVDRIEVIGQVVEEQPYGAIPIVEYLVAVRELTPEEYKLKNRVKVINNVLDSAPTPNNP